jgi:3-isopropylmalate/(R)-2-methylmalate dehydratase small subunit
MTPFICAKGTAVAFLEDDINTDQIAPLQLAKGLSPDWGQLLFKRQRMNADGTDNDHVLNKPQYQKPAILVANENFGCGSSRESAVWCLTGVGIRCVIAPDFADIFHNNSFKNGLLPIRLPREICEKLMDDAKLGGNARITVDLERNVVVRPNGEEIPFAIDPFRRHCLLNGLDEIGITLASSDAISAYEAKLAAEKPWLAPNMI